MFFLVSTVRDHQFNRLNMQLQAVATLGYNVNGHNVDGTTALHVACREGWEDVATQLINLGADPTISDLDDRTARDLALLNGFESLVDAIDRLHARSVSDSLAQQKFKGQRAPFL